MTKANYAFIKNGEVTNIAVFDSSNDELLSRFKKDFDLDELVLTTEKAFIGGTYDGQFWLPKPYPSWVKGSEDWEAPVFYPTDGKSYVWDESVIGWVEVTN